MAISEPSVSNRLKLPLTKLPASFSHIWKHDFPLLALVIEENHDLEEVKLSAARVDDRRIFHWGEVSLKKFLCLILH